MCRPFAISFWISMTTAPPPLPDFANAPTSLPELHCQHLARQVPGNLAGHGLHARHRRTLTAGPREGHWRGYRRHGRRPSASACQGSSITSTSPRTSSPLNISTTAACSPEAFPLLPDPAPTQILDGTPNPFTAPAPNPNSTGDGSRSGEDWRRTLSRLRLGADPDRLIRELADARRDKAQAVELCYTYGADEPSRSFVALPFGTVEQYNRALKCRYVYIKPDLLHSRRRTPYVTVRSDGRLTFNADASRALDAAELRQVRLFGDRRTKRVVIRPATGEGPETHLISYLRPTPTQIRATLEAKPFLCWLGYLFPRTAAKLEASVSPGAPTTCAVQRYELLSLPRRSFSFTLTVPQPSTPR